MYRDLSYTDTCSGNTAMNISVITKSNYVSIEEWASSANVITNNSSDATIKTRDFSVVVSNPVAIDWLIFKNLTRKWHQERGHTSSATKIAMCPSYQQIIGMGPKAVPFILRDIQNKVDDPDHWFWALSMITRADPVPVGIYGDHVEMARAWLSWAIEQGGSIAGQQSISQTSEMIMPS